MSLWGALSCLNCLFNNNVRVYDFFIDPALLIMPLLSTSNNKIKGLWRIGPHDQIIYSVIFGTLLGDGHAEKRNGATRISFYQESTHLSYLLWLHNLLSSKGYCNETLPEIKTRLGKSGRIRKTIRFHTWTYTSFNFIHDLFYKNKIKQVPQNINEYLTPLALAIWIMDDGTKVSKGLKFCTNSFFLLGLFTISRCFTIEF